MSLEQLHCSDSEFRQSKSTQQQSLQSIATLKSEQSIESLEKLVSQEQVKDSNLRVELDQFIGLLQKVKPSNLKNDLSVVMSTEQEEYYSFQPKQSQDKKEVMLEGFQKCYYEAIRIINHYIQDQFTAKQIISSLEKMQMIYIMQFQQFQGVEKSVNLINSLKQTLIDADQEITLLHNQTSEQQEIIKKLQQAQKSTLSELNQEKLTSMDLQQKNSQLKHLILVANKQFESLQEKLLQTEEELNLVVSQQNHQIIQLVQTNKNLREAIGSQENQQQLTNRSQNNQENQQNQSNQQPLQSYRRQQQHSSPQTTQRSISNKREWNRCTKIQK